MNEIKQQSNEAAVDCGNFDDLKARKLIQNEIELLRLEDSAAYMKGVEIAAEVVYNESFYSHYINVEKGQARPAAERIVDYWNCRRETFGQDRAFRPLYDLSGRGAMTEDDINVLKSGVHVHVSNDSEGSPILVNDISRLAPSASKFSLRRVLFYVHAKLSCSNPVAQTKGLVILRILNNSSFTAKERNEITQFYKSVNEPIFPMVVKRVHLCAISSEGNKKMFLKAMIPFHFQQGGKDLFQRTRVHISNDGNSILPELLKYGMNACGLVPQVGGTYSYEEKALFIQQQCIEDEDFKMPSITDQLDQNCKRKGKFDPLDCPPGKKREIGLEQIIPEKTHSTTTIPMHFIDELKIEMMLLPEIDRAAYEEALQRAPDVVEEESNPQMFLQVEDFDCRKAAKRLANYWAFRKNVFGPERFVKRVLDLTVHGALDEEDKIFYRSGANVFLPNDDEGCSVVCNDISRLASCPFKDKKHRLRGAVFGWTKIAVENRLTQTKGFEMIRIMQDPDVSSFMPANFKQSLVMCLNEIMPMKLKAFRICCVPPTGSKNHFLKTVLPRAVEVLGNDLISLTHIHFAVQGETSLLSKLEEHGFQKEGLVPILGGSWSYKTHESWFDEQMKITLVAAPNEVEDLATARVCEQTLPEQPGGNSKRKVTVQGKKRSSRKKTVEERKARKRKMDAIYARNRREREKGEEDKLRVQCVDLSQTNMKLEEDNQKLERILAEASAKVLLNEAHDEQTNDAKMSKSLPSVAFTASPESRSVDGHRVDIPPLPIPETFGGMPDPQMDTNESLRQESAIQTTLARQRMLRIQYEETIRDAFALRQESTEYSQALPASLTFLAENGLCPNNAISLRAGAEKASFLHAAPPEMGELTEHLPAQLSSLRYGSNLKPQNTLCLREGVDSGQQSQQNIISDSIEALHSMQQLQESQCSMSRHQRTPTGAVDFLQQVSNCQEQIVTQNSSIQQQIPMHLQHLCASFDQRIGYHTFSNGRTLPLQTNSQAPRHGNHISPEFLDETASRLLLLQLLRKSS